MNDEHISPNCEMKKVVCEGKPHLCLFALKKIFAGEEVTYNYGASSYPWRSTVGASYAMYLAFDFVFEFVPRIEDESRQRFSLFC